MKNTTFKRLLVKILAAVTAISCFAAVGCSGKGKTSGTVATDGSTSMAKVIGALGEAFMQANDDIKFTYNPTGSGSGITAVSEGRCDIGLSSRALKTEETDKSLVGTVLAYDGIAIIVHPDNNLTDIDIETLAKVYKGEITNWRELGGADGEIVLIGREPNSGTRDGFESITDTKDACKYRQELTSTGDVIAAVASNPNAIGYASLSALKRHREKLSPLTASHPQKQRLRTAATKVQRPFVLVTKKGCKNFPMPRRKFFDFITSEDAVTIINKCRRSCRKNKN